MSGAYLNHITLTTGHLARLPRLEPTDPAVQLCKIQLQRALAQRAPIDIETPTPGCTLGAATTGRALTATLYGPRARPWVTIGVAPRATVAPRLWEILTQTLAPYHTLQRPSAPWVAAVLYVHDTPIWVGAWERAMGCAWIDAF